MISRRKNRSDIQKQPYPHVADKISYNGEGFIKNGPLYLVDCFSCGKPAGIRTAGEINRSKKLYSGNFFCSNYCRKIVTASKKCPICNSLFEPRTRYNKFCSKDCYSLWQKTEENRGENHPRWKGGEYRLSRKRPEYKAWRTAVFERDDYICQGCFKRGGILNAHHIKTYKAYPELELDINNGVTLCKDCHYSIHSGSQRDEYPVQLLQEARYFHR